MLDRKSNRFPRSDEHPSEQDLLQKEKSAAGATFLNVIAAVIRNHQGLKPDDDTAQTKSFGNLAEAYLKLNIAFDQSDPDRQSQILVEAHKCLKEARASIKCVECVLGRECVDNLVLGASCLDQGMRVFGQLGKAQEFAQHFLRAVEYFQLAYESQKVFLGGFQQQRAA